jgi:hypothetical protein
VDERVICGVGNLVQEFRESKGNWRGIAVTEVPAKTTLLNQMLVLTIRVLYLAILYYTLALFCRYWRYR